MQVIKIGLKLGKPNYCIMVVFVVQRFGVGLVIERSLVRGPIKSTRSTQPSFPQG